MATCTLKETSAKTAAKGAGSAMFTYQLIADSVIIDPLDALAVARGLGVPAYGTALSSAYWFAQDFSVDRDPNNRNIWDIVVTFTPPPDGEDNAQQVENPLARPAVYDIQYIEQEYVVEQARNVENLTYGAGRVPGTLGPIVNGLMRRPDEPIVDTTRNPIITIDKNFASLGSIVELNETYLETCNSDTVNIGGRSISPRRLKFLVAASQGRQQEGDVVYYPARIEIELKKTTDLILDNVGYEFNNTLLGGVSRATTEDGDFTGDPVNLDLNGEYIDDETTTITYRYLTEVAYAGFFA